MVFNADDLILLRKGLEFVIEDAKQRVAEMEIVRAERLRDKLGKLDAVR